MHLCLRSHMYFSLDGLLSLERTLWATFLPDGCLQDQTGNNVPPASKYNTSKHIMTGKHLYEVKSSKKV